MKKWGATRDASQELAEFEVQGIVNIALGTAHLEGNTKGLRRKAINYLRFLWDGETWERIKGKLAVEGSAWVVWYMDGIGKYMQAQNGGEWNGKPLKMKRFYS
jgi:hypothetical protein